MKEGRDHYMNDVIMKESFLGISEGIRNANIKITLEGWSCATAVLGICATVVLVEAIKARQQVTIFEE